MVGSAGLRKAAVLITVAFLLASAILNVVALIIYVVLGSSAKNCKVCGAS